MIVYRLGKTQYSDDLSGEALFVHNPQQPMTINLQTLNLPFDTALTK